MPASGRIDELRKRYDENQRRFFAPLANEYRKSGDLEQAIALCRMHLADTPANLNGQIVFGQALYEAGTLGEARGAFEASIALDPENLIALRHLGDIAREQGDIPAARQWYKRVLDADRRNEDVLAIMEELAAVEAAGGSAAGSDSSSAGNAGIETIDLEEPPMRAPAPSRPSIMSLIGAPAPSDTREIPAVEAEAAPEPAPAEVLQIETTAIQEPETAAREPEPALSDDDTIDFGMVDAAPEPEAPESSFGLDVDLGAAGDIPVATSVGETGDFGVVELPDDAPFRETEEVRPAGVETAADSLLSRVEIQETVAVEQPIALDETIDLDSFGTVDIDAAPVPVEEPYQPPKLELVRSDEIDDTIDLIDDDEVAAMEAVEATETVVEEVEDAPPAAAETMSRRSTPVVFNFDVSLDDAPRSPTPLGIVAAEASEEPEPVEEDVREMPTPVIQPAVEAFATETMAELYVKQGLRHEAIGVYKQLIEARPGDKSLRDRLAELEDEGQVAAGSSARAFFSSLSRRSAKGRPSGSHKLPESTPPRGSLDRLFGDASVARLDESAAQSLSAAFGSGPAEQEESALDRVFSARPARPPGR